MLPVEVLRLIAAVSPASYRAMLALPPFARSLDPGTIADYMILFGHGVEVTRDAIVWWYRGATHRVGGPAVEYVGGGEEWHNHGHIHRVGGPALVTPAGSRLWYCHGNLHRDDGPAVEYFDGGTVYYNNGTIVYTVAASYFCDKKTLMVSIYNHPCGIAAVVRRSRTRTCKFKLRSGREKYPGGILSMPRSARVFSIACSLPSGSTTMM